MGRHLFAVLDEADGLLPGGAQEVPVHDCAEPVAGIAADGLGISSQYAVRQGKGANDPSSRVAEPGLQFPAQTRPAGDHADALHGRARPGRLEAKAIGRRFACSEIYVYRPFKHILCSADDNPPGCVISPLYDGHGLRKIFDNPGFDAFS